jgi:ribonuclease HI
VSALVDRDMEVKYLHHPAETITYLTVNNEETSTIQIFTDGSKSEQGVGAGVAIFKSGTHIKSLKYKLNKRCTNNQAEQLAILRAVDYTENLQTEDKTATIYTDSRMTLDSLKLSKIRTFLIEEIRRKLREVEKINWKFNCTGLMLTSGSKEMS